MPRSHSTTSGQRRRWSGARWHSSAFNSYWWARFSLLMFVLAVIGTYGVTAYQVTERTKELGIRAALGATAGDIRRLVVREGGRSAIIGILIGGFATLALSRVLTRFVSHVSPLDLGTYILVPIVFALATLLAAFVPAHRAARADPMKALRVE